VVVKGFRSETKYENEVSRVLEKELGHSNMDLARKDMGIYNTPFIPLYRFRAISIEGYTHFDKNNSLIII